MSRINFIGRFNWADMVVRYRWLWIASTLIVSLLLGLQLDRLVLDGSVERIMLRNDPERIFNEQASKMFGGDEIVTVVLPCASGIWQETSLREIDRITNRLENLEGVSQVHSVTNMPVAGLQTLVDQLNQGVSAEALRSVAESHPLVKHNLISADGLHAAINIRLVPLKDRPIDFKTMLAKNIRDTVEQQVPKGGYSVAGWPIIQADLTNYMERDLFVLIPAVAVVVMLLFAISFQRLSGVFLPVATIALAQVWTVGGIVAAGRSMSMVTYSLPVVIIAIGATYCIHVITHIFRELDQGNSRLDAVRRSLVSTGPSVLLSGFTTMIGFGALKFNRLEAIDEFGTFAVWGIAVSVFMSLVFLPSLASIMPLGRKRPRRSWLSLQPAKFVGGVLAHRNIVWACTVVVLFAGMCGVMRIRVETAPVGWFPADSEIRAAVDNVNNNMAGITPYNIVIETPRVSGVYDRDLLDRIENLQRWLEIQPEVDTTGSIVDLLKLALATVAERGQMPQIPNDAREIKRLCDAMRQRETRQLDTFISDDGRVANVIFRSPIVSSEEGILLADRVDAYLKENFNDMAGARITGTGHLTFRTNLQFTSGLATSLSIGIGVICLTMIVLFGSWKLGLLAVVPNVLPILINYAIMGLCSLTLNAATSITGCIAIGIAVDDTIHFLMAFREGLRKNENDRRLAVEYALEQVGRPMLITSVALSAGFSVLMLSNFEPVTSLGLLVAVTMIACLVCDTVLLPVLLTIGIAPATRRSTQRSSRSLRAIPATEQAT